MTREGGGGLKTSFFMDVISEPLWKMRLKILKFIIFLKNSMFWRIQRGILGSRKYLQFGRVFTDKKPQKNTIKD